MSILTTDLRNKRNQFLYAPPYRTVAHYYTNTTKNNEMKDLLLGEEFFFNHTRPLSELLKKNLADTLVNQQSGNTEMASSKEPKMVNNSDYSKLSSITNFISGVFSVVSSVVFKKPKSPVDCFDCDHMSLPDNWQYSSSDYKNELGPSVDVSKPILSTMCDLNTVAGSCDVKKYQGEHEFNDFEANNKLVETCEEKLSKLKAYLQQRHKDKSKVSLESNLNDSTELQPSKSIPISNGKSKRFKNPNRLCSKRVKTNMKLIIEDEMLFADEVDLDDFSSVEDSPSFHSLEKWSESPHSNDTTPQDFFDEIAGRFQTGSAVSSEGSFQIVFSDLPKRVRSTSDCDSEDSFIIFEDSPDSCYTSNDVFSDSDDGSDSDSDMSDSGCGNMKLSQSLSRTVSNLTDDSLYDEVDSGNSVLSSMVLHKDGSKLGLITDQRKHPAKKELPVKKVHFSPLPPKVHVMHVWAYAARQARAGHWEQYAVDRERFRRRIAEVDLTLSWVLKPQHRTRIMFQRFMPWWNAQKRKELAEKNELDRALREAERLKENVVIEEIFEDNNENYTETLTQDKELKTDERQDDNLTLDEECKQREIITNNEKDSLEEDGIQKKRKQGKTKTHRKEGTFKLNEESKQREIIMHNGKDSQEEDAIQKKRKERDTKTHRREDNLKWGEENKQREIITNIEKDSQKDDTIRKKRKEGETKTHRNDQTEEDTFKLDEESKQRELITNKEKDSQEGDAIEKKRKEGETNMHWNGQTEEDTIQIKRKEGETKTHRNDHTEENTYKLDEESKQRELITNKEKDSQEGDAIEKKRKEGETNMHWNGQTEEDTIRKKRKEGETKTHRNDQMEENNFKLNKESKQRQIITNNGKDTQEEDTMQKKRKEGQTKTHRNVPEGVEILHTKAENQRDRAENGINIVRYADKRILKSNGI